MMAMIYPLHNNKTINRWMVSDIIEKKVDFEPVTMHGDVNEWLLQGFSIHENPCKTEFANISRNQMHFEQDVFADLGSWKIYFPWGNPNVEFSHFWFDPTHLSTYAHTQLLVESNRKVEFELTTCGGAVVLINGQEVERFMPFTRNIIQKSCFNAELQEGLNNIQIRFDDLAERDTQYLFRLDCLNQEDIMIQLDTGEDDDKTKVLMYYEKLLKEMYLLSDYFCEQEIVFYWDKPLEHDGVATVEIVPGEILADDKTQTVRIELKKGARSIKLGNSSQFYTGYNTFVIRMIIGNQTIQKTLNAQIYNSKAMKLSNEDADIRKKIAIDYISKYGVNDLHRALAMLKTGHEIPTAKVIIEKHIDMINHRYDCSDFYLVSLLKIWIDYRQSDVFKEEFWKNVEQCILNFRYWMDEPGDDVMWFFSENHALLFHTCELIAGQLFPEKKFTNAQIIGTAHVKKAVERLSHWFERFFDEGITEWNSSAYIPIDVLGLVNLYMMSENVDLRQKAKQGLDLIAKDLAINSHKGVLSCTFGRSYTKELKGNYTNGSSFLNWIMWNQGYVNQSTLGTLSLCLSDYTPPKEYASFLNMKSKEALVYQRTQGYQDYVNVYAYKTNAYQLSSVKDFKPGQKGYQEHVIHGFYGKNSLFWINHPGEAFVGGSGRPNYWAGNGILPRVVQYKSLAIVMYKIPEIEEIDFTHLYLPQEQFDEVQIYSQCIFLKKENAYGAIYAHNGLRIVESGETRYREIQSQGRENFWIVKMGEQDTYKSFDKFIEVYKLMFDQVEASSTENINFQEPIFGNIQVGWDIDLKVNKTIVKFQEGLYRERIEEI